MVFITLVGVATIGVPSFNKYCSPPCCAGLPSVALGSPWPFIYFITIVYALWYNVSMKAKERSLSKYPDFEDYKKKTWFLIPFVY
jgi:protein-S-isoprenylcysteine O-methyltransferase Ste14